MKKNLFLTALAGAMTVASLAASPAQAGPLYFQHYGLGVSGLEFQAPFYFRSFAGQLMVDQTGTPAPPTTSRSSAWTSPNPQVG